MLRRIIGNVHPWCLRPDIVVSTSPDTGITIEDARRYVDLFPKDHGQISTAYLAETSHSSFRRFVVADQIVTLNNLIIVRPTTHKGRESRAMSLAAHGTVTIPHVCEITIYLESEALTQTTAFNHEYLPVSLESDLYSTWPSPVITEGL